MIMNQLVGKKLEGGGHNLPQGYPANHLRRLNKTIKTSFRIAVTVKISTGYFLNITLEC